VFAAFFPRLSGVSSFLTPRNPIRNTVGDDRSKERGEMMEEGNQARSYQAKYALAERLRLSYRDASHAQKTALLDAFVQVTGYTRKSAIRVLGHAPEKPGSLTRARSPQ